MRNRPTRPWRKSSARSAPGPRTAADLPQLGEKLRAQRLRRGLELTDVAAAVDVPAKSLRAVEWDRLDLLGDDADRIVTAYASFLGVDLGAAPVDAPRERAAVEQRRPPRKPMRGRSTLLWIAVGAPLVAALAYVVGLTLREAAQGTPGERQVKPTTRAATPRTAQAPRMNPVRPKRRRARPPVRPPVRLIVVASRGDSWVEARVGSPTGAPLFDGTLRAGRRLQLSGRRLWVRFGAASNLALTLNGRPAGEGLYGTVETLVTPEGIRPT